MGQVFAIHGLVPSLIIWLAVALYNPLLAALSAAGALMGSFIPLLLLGKIAVIYSNHKQSNFPCQTLTTIITTTITITIIRSYLGSSHLRQAFLPHG